MKLRRYKSLNEVAEILRRYRSQEPIASIAAAFGVSRAYPRKLAKRHGVPLRSPEISRGRLARPKPKPWKPEPNGVPTGDHLRGDVRSRLLAGEPMLVVAADFDLGLDELISLAMEPS